MNRQCVMLRIHSIDQGLNVARILSILLGIFFFSPPAIAETEDLAGLRYWHKISKEAITTASGLQYKVLINGTGRKPRAKDKVIVHYRGLLLNGVQFDTSYTGDEPLSFRLKNMIKGWIEGVQLMPVGSVFVFLIPPELGYGSRGSGGVPADATLIFEIELIGIK